MMNYCVKHFTRLKSKTTELLREGESNKDFDLNKIAKLENDITKLENREALTTPVL